MTPVQKAAGLGHNYNREYTNLSTAEETGHSPYFPERGSIPFCWKVSISGLDSTIKLLRYLFSIFYPTPPVACHSQFSGWRGRGHEVLSEQGSVFR